MPNQMLKLRSEKKAVCMMAAIKFFQMADGTYLSVPKAKKI